MEHQTENVTVLWKDLETICEGQEKIREQRALDVERKKNEAKQNLEVQVSLTTALRSKTLLKEQCQCLNNTNDVSLLNLKEDTDRLKDDHNERMQQRRDLMKNLESRTQKCVHRFSSAPEKNDIKYVSKEIESLEKMITEDETKISTAFNPEIRTLNAALEREPVTSLKMQGFVSTELTSKDLRIMTDKLNDDCQKFHCNIEDGLKEIELLKEEENDLN